VITVEFCVQEISRDVASHSSSVNSLKQAGQMINSPYVNQHLVKFDAAFAQLNESIQVVNLFMFLGRVFCYYMWIQT
jgi:hypothetical protein